MNNKYSQVLLVFRKNPRKRNYEWSSVLKTCTALIVGIFELIFCFNEVFLMALTSTEQLFIERLLHKRFLHNDYLPSQQTFVLIKTSWRRLWCSSSEDVLVKTNIFILAIRLQDVFKTCLRRLAKTSSRHLRDVLPRRLQDVLKNVFKTSSRRFQDVSSS